MMRIILIVVGLLLSLKPGAWADSTYLVPNQYCIIPYLDGNGDLKRFYVFGCDGKYNANKTATISISNGEGLALSDDIIQSGDFTPTNPKLLNFPCIIEPEIAEGRYTACTTNSSASIDSNGKIILKCLCTLSSDASDPDGDRTCVNISDPTLVVDDYDSQTKTWGGAGCYPAYDICLDPYATQQQKDAAGCPPETGG